MTQDELNTHLQMHYGDNRVTSSAFKGTMLTVSRSFAYYSVPNINYLRISQDAKLHNIVHYFLSQHIVGSVYLSLQARFAKFDVDGGIDETFIMPMLSLTTRLFRDYPQGVTGMLQRCYEDFQDRIDRAETRGSGYLLQDIVSVGVHMAKVRLAGGGRPYKRSMDMAEFKLTEREKKFSLDVESSVRGHCLYSAISQGFISEESEEGEHYFAKGTQRYLQTSAVERMLRKLPGRGPVLISHLARVEKMNRKNFDFALNVYAKHRDPHTKKISYFPVYASQRSVRASKRINLFLCGDVGRDDATDLHFVYIQNIERFMGLPDWNKITVCFYCLNTVCKASIEKHLSKCSVHGGQKIVLPEKDAHGNPPLVTFQADSKRFYTPIRHYENAS